MSRNFKAFQFRSKTETHAKYNHDNYEQKYLFKSLFCFVGPYLTPFFQTQQIVSNCGAKWVEYCLMINFMLHFIIGVFTRLKNFGKVKFVSNRWRQNADGLIGGATWGSSGAWFGSLLGVHFQRRTRQDRLEGEPGADPGYVGGIKSDSWRGTGEVLRAAVR